MDAWDALAALGAGLAPTVPKKQLLRRISGNAAADLWPQCRRSPSAPPASCRLALDPCPERPPTIPPFTIVTAPVLPQMLRMTSTDPGGDVAREQQQEGSLERELREIHRLSGMEEEEEGRSSGVVSARAGDEAAGEVRLQLGGTRLDDLGRIEPLPGEHPALLARRPPSMGGGGAQGQKGRGAARVDHSSAGRLLQARGRGLLRSVTLTYLVTSLAPLPAAANPRLQSTAT